MKKLKIDGLAHDMFNTLEREKMMTVLGGYDGASGCSQLNTATTGSDTSDGADDLAPGESQD